MTERDPNAAATPTGTDPAEHGSEPAESRKIGGETGNATMAELDGHGIVERDRLVERVDAIERAIVGEGDGSVSDLSDRAALEGRLAELESAVETIEERVDELDAATQAVRGYVGSIRAVNREVESRADLALATAERVERRCRPTAGSDSSVESPNPPTRSGGRTDGGRIAAGTTDRNDRARRTSKMGDDCRDRTDDLPPAVAAAIPDEQNATTVGKSPDVARAEPNAATSEPDVARTDPDVESGILAKLRNAL